MDREYKKYGTHFTETEALLVVQQWDDTHAEALINEMTQGERMVLARACDRLARMLRENVGRTTDG